MAATASVGHSVVDPETQQRIPLPHAFEIEKRMLCGRMGRPGNGFHLAPLVFLFTFITTGVLKPLFGQRVYRPSRTLMYGRRFAER